MLLARAAMGKTALVLGAGFVGRRLLAAIVASGEFAEVVGTRRHSAAVAEEQSDWRCVQFNLEEESTWHALPDKVDFCVVTLPLRPLSCVQGFIATYLAVAKPSVLLVYGSTSCYKDFEPHADVTEESPLDLGQERVAGEEEARVTAGAAVLQLSGIHGHERRVENWFKMGRIGGKNRLLNLIHVDDIVAVSVELWERRAQWKADEGIRLNVSDGRKRWIYDMAEAYGVAIDPDQASSRSTARTSKFVVNDRLMRLLGGGFTFRDITSAP